MKKKEDVHQDMKKKMIDCRDKTTYRHITI